MNEEDTEQSRGTEPTLEWYKAQQKELRDIRHRLYPFYKDITGDMYFPEWLEDYVKQLQAENERYKEVFDILSPYHGKTNKKGRLEAIESSIKFVESRFAKHDTEDISSCTRCNAFSLAKWMKEIIKALKG